MGGTALRECIRLFYPGGSQPQRFPALLPSTAWALGRFTLRLDNLLMLAAGVALVLGVSLLLQRTRAGLAIRAVAQDEETARTMGIDFRRVVLFTFALGSALAAFAGVMNGLYYNEINFGSGLLLGVIGFSCRGPRRAGQPLGRRAGGVPVCRAADAGGSRHALRLGLQGRLRLRDGHPPLGLEADRADWGTAGRAGMTRRSASACARHWQLWHWPCRAALLLYGFLAAESEGRVALVLAGAALAAALGWRTGLLGLGGPGERPSGAWSLAFAFAGLALVAAFHEDPFVLLLLARALIALVACLGLHVQLADAGVPNFAGAAFFGVGGYTAAVLGQERPAPPRGAAGLRGPGRRGGFAAAAAACCGPGATTPHSSPSPSASSSGPSSRSTSPSAARRA